MNLKWWIILDALVFYTPIPFLILFGKTEFAIYLAGSGTFLIFTILSLYATGVREMSRNPLKFVREDPKATLIGFVIIGGVMLLCKIFNVIPPRYP